MTNPIKMTQWQINLSEMEIEFEFDVRHQPENQKWADAKNEYRRKHLIELVPDDPKSE